MDKKYVKIIVVLLVLIIIMIMIRNNNEQKNWERKMNACFNNCMQRWGNSTVTNGTTEGLAQCDAKCKEI